MRVNWNYIKGLVLLLTVGFLFAFASARNSERKIMEVTVNFVGENPMFITDSTVNKLLIQNEGKLTALHKDKVDLNQLETALKSNPMIKTAEVYLTVNGEVRADVEQRKPIARVSTNASYYIDAEGLFMPLSENRSARVPLVTGHIYKNDLGNVYRIAKRIHEDEFLRVHVVEIVQHPDESISLRFRELDFEVFMGRLDRLDKKIFNLKAFYQKAMKDGVLEHFSKINLQFDNQVVCTKK